jgi:hypothetical protein
MRYSLFSPRMLLKFCEASKVTRWDHNAAIIGDNPGALNYGAIHPARGSARTCHPFLTVISTETQVVTAKLILG